MSDNTFAGKARTVFETTVSKIYARRNKKENSKFLKEYTKIETEEFFDLYDENDDDDEKTYKFGEIECQNAV